MCFKESHAESEAVLSPLETQRDQVNVLAPDAASAMARTTRIDEMMGSWLNQIGQLNERIAKVCS
jgi:hypothetical protein